MSRYKLNTSKFGQCLFDAQEGKDMSLTEVLDLLNAADDKVFNVRNEAAKADGEQVLEIRRLTRELEERTAERDALQTQIDGEAKDWLAARKRLGVRDDEGLDQFVERLAYLSECDEVRDLRHEVSELKSERDEDRLYGQQVHDRAIKALSDAGIESKGVAMGIDELAEERDDLVRARDAARKAIKTPETEIGVLKNADNGLKSRIGDERRRRVYYQGIVYAVCRLIDPAEHRIVCGTVDNPSTRVQERVRALVDDEAEHVAALKAEAKKSLDFMSKICAPGGIREEGRTMDNEMRVSRATIRKTVKPSLCGDDRQREAHDVLTAAGVPGNESSVAQRIDLLVLERDDVRREVESLCTRNRHMAGKLTRIINATSEDRVLEIAQEALPPIDSAAVEIEHANMLQEIDDLLQDHGARIGGRLDSIKTLLGQRDGMRNLLLTIHRFIDDNRAAINSWVVTTVEER